MEQSYNPQNLAIQVDRILREELEESKLAYDLADVSVSEDPLSVGVQGDARTYGHVALIDIRKGNKPVFNDELYARLSARIPNEVSGINRVVYFTA